MDPAPHLARKILSRGVCISTVYGALPHTNAIGTLVGSLTAKDFGGKALVFSHPQYLLQLLRWSSPPAHGEINQDISGDRVSQVLYGMCTKYYEGISPN